MIRSKKEFFPRFIFSLVFVYVIFLGILNLLITFNKSKIEVFLADLLEAKQVTIGHISNLPLVFISGTEFSIDVNDNLSFTIEGFYIHYRFFKLFTKEYTQVIKEIEVNSIIFNGHTVEIDKYKEILAKKFSSLSVKKTNAIDINSLISNISTVLKIRRVILTFNIMQEFWHKITFDNINVNIINNQVKWFSKINLNSIWSNQVLIAETSMTTEGKIDNLSDIQSPNTLGYIDINIASMNLSGIPLVKSNMIIHTEYSNHQYNVNLVDMYKTNNIKLKTDDQFAFTLQNSFMISYKPYEEYQLLDYVFKPGLWNLSIDIIKKADWNVDAKLSSPNHPDYGLTIDLNPIKKDKLYSVLLDLRTHYFGSMHGDLIVPIRKGLYPLPSGSLHLDNVRFILSGLIFSGNIVADMIPNQNKIQAAAFDVKMNGGHIGNTSVIMEFTPEGVFNIYPQQMKNSSVDVTASIGSSIFVELKAFDVDGDFVAQNIKIPIFGIKESRYRGLITMHKESYLDPFFLDGYLKGYLDGEEQVDAIISLEDTLIQIPRFYLVNQDILLDGEVLITPYHSNTVVSIDAQGSYKQNNVMPIDITVDIKRDEVLVSGIVDEVVPINTYTKGDLTKFKVDFSNYPMDKFGIEGHLDAYFVMSFTGSQISRFAIQEGKWKAYNREFILDFDSVVDTNTSLLNTTYMKLGMDKDVLDSYGYFSFLNNQFSGSFRFDRGGSFQFNMGRYVVKSHVNIQKLEIDNMFSNIQLDTLSILKTEETEVVLASLDTIISGTWSDLTYEGALNIEGKDQDEFRFTIPKFVVSNNVIAVTNVRLRHPRLNLDTDTYMHSDDQNLQINSKGSLALNSILKVDFAIDYNKITNNGILKYNLPNLYFLSTKPMALKGQIIHDQNNYLFVSDNSKSGIVGSYFANNRDRNWDMSLLNKSMRLTSEGKIIDGTIDSFLNWDIFLKKLSLSGDFRKVAGDLRINTVVNGSIDNPIINGELVSKNIDLSLRSLRNRLQITNQQKIYISNNNIIIPDVTINAVDGGEFGLIGSVSIQDQAIGNTDLKFYSKNNSVSDTSSLNWNLEVPYLFVKGKTFINDITINGDLNSFLLSSHIDTENLNIGLELDDTLSSSTSDVNNPLLGILALMDLDININLKNKSRFLNQLFDMEFEQRRPVKISGNMGDGSLNVVGDFDISKGKVAYLNADLAIDSGIIQFSGDQSDVVPYIYLQTETKRSIQNELVDIQVGFEGKLPNLELAKITSTPSKPRSELLNMLGFGGSADLDSYSANNSQNASSAQDLIANSVGVAENALFTTPLSRKIQQLVPFIDTFQIKTDVLGNLTRSVNSTSGSAVTGLSILHGSELEVGQYLPGISGLQVKYNLRLESPENSSLDSGSLNQIHKAGIEWSRMIPYTWQLGVGANVLGEVKPQEQQNLQPEFIFEGSLKKRF